jgi:hypothetical protein
LSTGIAISAVLLWFAGRNTDLDEIWQTMRGANLAAVVPFTACMLVFYVIRTYRWKVLLSPISNVGTRDLFGPVMIGYGANFILPFQLGEVARTMAAMDSTRLPFTPIAFSILVERLFDFLVILAALAISLSMHDQLPGYVTTFGLSIGAVVAALIAIMVLFVLRTDFVLAGVERMIMFLPAGISAAIMRQLRIGVAGLQSLRSRRVLLVAGLTSVVQWGFIALCIWVSLLAVGVAVPVPTVLLILALIVLGSSIPTAPGFLGSFQAGYVVGIEAINGDAVQGMSASIFYHVIYAATALTLGMLALQHSRLSWRTLTTTDSV